MDTTTNNSGLQDLIIFDKQSSLRPLSDQLQSQIFKNQPKSTTPLNAVNSSILSNQ